MSALRPRSIAGPPAGGGGRKQARFPAGHRARKGVLPLREYETVFLLHPSLDDKEVEAEITAVCGLVTGSGGTIEEVERWGRRRLAYEIQKVHDGTYTLVRFKAGSQTLADLSRRYRLNEKLLRHLTIRSEGPPAPPTRPETERENQVRSRRDDGEFELPRSRSGGYADHPGPAAAEPRPAPAVQPQNNEN
jgi:small subunit ribosomal protein S6